METLGTLLLKQRQQQKKCQKEIADLINVSQSTYCDWEGDRSMPKAKHFLTIAHALGISIEEIFQCIYGTDKTETQRLKAEINHLRQQNQTLQQTIDSLQTRRDTNGMGDVTF